MMKVWELTICEDGEYKPNYTIEFGGSPFPSHYAYHKDLNVGSHNQTDVESLLFGDYDGEINDLNEFHQTDWTVAE